MSQSQVSQHHKLTNLFRACFLVSIISFTGILKLYVPAYPCLIALDISLVLVTLIAFVSHHKYFIVHPNEHVPHTDDLIKCEVCEQNYAQTGFAYSPFQYGAISSLCWTVDSSCRDQSKTAIPLFFQQVISMELA